MKEAIVQGSKLTLTAVQGRLTSSLAYSTQVEAVGIVVVAIWEASIRASVRLCQVSHQAGMWPKDILGHPGHQTGAARLVYWEHWWLEKPKERKL